MFLNVQGFELDILWWKLEIELKLLQMPLFYFYCIIRV